MAGPGPRMSRSPWNLVAALDCRADRLTRAMKAARGDAGEHLLEHQATERIAIGEVLIGGQRDLRLAVGAPDPRALDRNAPSADCHLAVLAAVGDRHAIDIVPARGADHVVDLLLHQLAQNPKPDTDAQREQALLRRVLARFATGDGR